MTVHDTTIFPEQQFCLFSPYTVPELDTLLPEGIQSPEKYLNVK
jgi:hypothetical protein